MGVEIEDGLGSMLSTAMVSVAEVGGGVKTCRPTNKKTLRTRFG